MSGSKAELKSSVSFHHSNQNSNSAQSSTRLQLQVDNSIPDGPRRNKGATRTDAESDERSRPSDAWSMSMVDVDVDLSIEPEIGGAPTTTTTTTTTAASQVAQASSDRNRKVLRGESEEINKRETETGAASSRKNLVNSFSRSNSDKTEGHVLSQSVGNWALSHPQDFLSTAGRKEPGSLGGIVAAGGGGGKARVRPTDLNPSLIHGINKASINTSPHLQDPHQHFMDQFAPVFQPEQQQQQQHHQQPFQHPQQPHNLGRTLLNPPNPNQVVSMSEPGESAVKIQDGPESKGGSEGGGGGASSAAKLLLVSQILIAFCFMIFVTYDTDADAVKSLKVQTENRKKKPASGSGSGSGADEDVNVLPSFYPMFQDVHVMIFVGFGFLMTFLRKYGYSAVGYTLMISAVAIQWSILCRGVFHHDGNNIPINIQSLINGDFAAAAVLISFGAILGVSSPLQLLVMAFIEVFLYAVNEYIGVELLKAIDIGGSMFIHTFGAYFGLAVSFMMRKQSDCHSDKEEATATSDVFAMIGTVFLWMFWPSFNAVMATGDDQHRAVLNTVLSLTGSCLLSFAMSSLLSPDNKFNMVHVQNATLAGGVAVGATADLMIKPFGALIIGGGAGILSTAGYVYITPFLQKAIGLHDTCGVHNLHGMPGVLAGLIGSILAFTASENDYGKSLYLQYPARAPLEGSAEMNDLLQDLSKAEPGLNRTAAEQAVYQLAALGVTLLIGIVGGAITGVILKIPALNSVGSDGLFDDSHAWSVPEEESGGQPQLNSGGGISAISGMNYDTFPNKYKDSKDSQL